MESGREIVTQFQLQWRRAEDKAIEKEITNLSRNKSGASKLDSSSLVASPKTFDVQTPNDLEVKIPKDSKVKTPVSAPKLSQVNVKKEPDVPEVLEDKNAPEIPKVMTDEVKAAESELLKVSEVTTSED
ncbi:hypothetical protein F2Q69_00004823 [Brassica cretica]|uniref:Uncharacterized protein n=1 Tax=Brassica cretica TaxID=69181 RepID=A0A8S9P9D1_BRACR|nr:hypothetical protein F2Q69_00004823 [Brassica cretica]